MHINQIPDKFNNIY